MTVGVAAKTRMDTRKLKRRVNDANFRNLGHAAAAVRLTARRSIRRRKKKSLAGAPPSTRKGRLKRAILYKVSKEKDEAVIGPDVDKVGTAGAAHEHGGLYKGDRYDRRPFMGPAFQKVKPRLPRLWGNSVR